MLWRKGIGWIWPPPPGTKARAFPGPEGRTAGCEGAAMMTGWALTGDPTESEEDGDYNCCYYNTYSSIRTHLEHSGSTGTLIQMLHGWPAARGGHEGSENPPCSDIQESADR